MTSNSSLELLIKITANAVQAKAVMDAFESSINGSLKNIQQTGEGFNATFVGSQAALKGVSTFAAQLGAEVEVVGQKAAEATARVGMFSPEMYRAYAAIQLLSRELGIPIPFALARIIGQMSSIGPIVSGAFGVIVGGFVLQALSSVTGKVTEFLTETKEAEKAWKAVNTQIARSYDELERLNDEDTRVRREETEVGKDAVETARLKAVYAQNDITFAKDAAEAKQRELSDAQKTLETMQQQRELAESIGSPGLGARALVERMSGISSGAISIQESKVAQLGAEYEVLKTKIRNAGDEAVLAAQRAVEAQTKADEKAEKAGETLENRLERQREEVKDLTDAFAGGVHAQLDLESQLDEAAVGGNKRAGAERQYDAEIKRVDDRIERARREKLITVQMEQDGDREKLLARANYLERLRQIDNDELAENQRKQDRLDEEEEQWGDSRKLRQSASVKPEESGESKEEFEILKQHRAVLATIHQLYASITLQQIAADPAILNNAKAWNEQFRAMHEGLPVLAQLVQQYGVAKVAQEAFSNSLVGGAESVAQAMGLAAGSALVYGKNIGAALEQAAKAALASLAGQSLGQALFCLAQGLWFLAQGVFFNDPEMIAAADLDFSAAAMFGAIGAGAAAIGAAIPGGGRGGATASRGSGGSGSGHGSGLNLEATAGASSYGTRVVSGGSAPPTGQVIVVGTREFGAYVNSALTNHYAQWGGQSPIPTRPQPTSPGMVR